VNALDTQITETRLVAIRVPPAQVVRPRPVRPGLFKRSSLMSRRASPTLSSIRRCFDLLGVAVYRVDPLRDSLSAAVVAPSACSKSTLAPGPPTPRIESEPLLLRHNCPGRCRSVSNSHLRERTSAAGQMLLPQEAVPHQGRSEAEPRSEHGPPPDHVVQAHVRVRRAAESGVVRGQRRLLVEQVAHVAEHFEVAAVAAIERV
jgi:hypothetical protein